MKSPKIVPSLSADISFWLGIIFTLAMVIIIRESSVWVCQQFGIATAGNIVGLVVMFIILISWRTLRHNSASKKPLSSNYSSDTLFSHTLSLHDATTASEAQRDKSNNKKDPHLPHWLTESSNKLLIDSGFAFLPVSAGGGLLLIGLGEEMWRVIFTLVISTLIPMWALANLGDIWLGKKEI